MSIHPRRTILRSIIVLTGACIAVASAQAPEPDAVQLYDVELVLFSVAHPSASAEDWDFEASLGPNQTETTEAVEPDDSATPPQTADLTPPALPPEPEVFPPLSTGDLRLGTIAASIQRSSTYELIGDFGWTQPGLGSDVAPTVDIGTYLPEGSPISGTVKLVRSRFLHLGVNLVFVAPDGRHYVLREQRRMQRSGEKHYLDHPYFGVVAIVTPRN